MLKQHSVHAADFRDAWRRIWQLAVRKITLPATSRASCFLLTLLLQFGLLKYADVVDSIDNMLSAVDVYGPNGCENATADFWRTVINLKIQENVGSLNATSNVVLTWLNKHWNVGR